MRVRLDLRALMSGDCEITYIDSSNSGNLSLFVGPPHGWSLQRWEGRARPKQLFPRPRIVKSIETAALQGITETTVNVVVPYWLILAGYLSAWGGLMAWRWKKAKRIAMPHGEIR